MSFGYVEEQNEPPVVKIKVIGVGGGGNNAVQKMVGMDLEGVELVIANTDMQVLNKSSVHNKIQLGAKLTNGMGAGSKPDVGRAAAEESAELIKQHLNGADIVFIASGMGGGTGTGASPIIARLAREMGILSIAIVTKPFSHEGPLRRKAAEEGIKALKEEVNCLIVIPNDHISKILGREIPILKAFAEVDNILCDGVQSLTDIIIRTGFINMDLSDIKSSLEQRGMGMICAAEAEGESRARVAAEKAISSPLLENINIQKARAILVNVSGNSSIGIGEYEEATSLIFNMIENAHGVMIKQGLTVDETLGNKVRVSILATGIQDDEDEAFLNNYNNYSNPFQTPMGGMGSFGSGMPDYIKR